MNKFIERYKQLCPDFELVSDLPSYLRVNTLKITEQEIVKMLKSKKVELKKVFTNCYEFKSPFPISSSPEYLQGFIYIQDAASQIAAITLNPTPNSRVLDMCAAPGSKTTYLAQLMNNTGTLIALDSVFPRIKSLKNNLERLGISNCIVYKKDAKYADDLNLEFDFVLLDAPCSGNYTQDENWFEQRNLDDLPAINRDQKDLFKAAYKVLKKGGTLVYSTCSLEPEENEMMMDWALAKYPDLELVDPELKLGDPAIFNPFNNQLNPEINKCIRFWPHKTNTDGFFLAKLRKK